jgi:hypothetical protein
VARRRRGLGGNLRRRLTAIFTVRGPDERLVEKLQRGRVIEVNFSALDLSGDLHLGRNAGLRRPSFAKASHAALRCEPRRRESTRRPTVTHLASGMSLPGELHTVSELGVLLRRRPSGQEADSAGPGGPGQAGHIRIQAGEERVIRGERRAGIAVPHGRERPAGVIVPRSVIRVVAP